MNPFPMGTGVKVWLSTGHTDMRCGFPSLALRVQEVLKHDPLSGHLFVFRGRRSDILKIIWHDGLGACLFTGRLEKGRFIWPNVEGGAVPAHADQRDRPCAEARDVATVHLADVQAKIADLKRMERVLKNMIAQCADGTLSECPLIETLFRVPDNVSRIA